MVETKHEMVTYLCNRCQQKRIIVLPAAMDIKEDPRGLSEYVDLHECQNSNLTANVLFIDPQHAVRSQVHISSGAKEAPTQEGLATFQIPIPKKTDLTVLDIELDSRFNASYIKKLEIKDKLRKLQYNFDSKPKQELEEYSVKSPLEFFEIKATFSKAVTSRVAKEWLEVIANIIVEVVNLNEKVFTYLLLFLDLNAKKKPKEREISELELLLNSTTTLPYCTKESVKIFKEKGDKIFTNITVVDIAYYQNILRICKDNETKTLFEILIEMIDRVSISYFLSSFYNLSEEALIEIEKLQIISPKELESVEN